MGLILGLNVYAAEAYEITRVDVSALGSRIPSPRTIGEENKFYFIGDKYECLGVNESNICDLYSINSKYELVKENKLFEGYIVNTPSYYLQEKKNEDGSYDLYSCYSLEDSAGTEECKLIPNIDVAALIKSSETLKTGESYVSGLNIITKITNFYIVQGKDGFVAVYDGQGNKYLDFGNYKILGEINLADDGINATIRKIVLKDLASGSYYIIGQEKKIVLITKAISEKVGIDDNIATTVRQKMDEYYAFDKGDKTIFFTLTDGLINDKEFRKDALLERYNNTHVIKETLKYEDGLQKFNLYSLDGNPILEQEKYHRISYSSKFPEIIFVVDKYTGDVSLSDTKFDKSVIYIYDGNKIIYSKELNSGDMFKYSTRDKEGNIWISAYSENKKGAIYILKKNASNSPTEDEVVLGDWNGNGKYTLVDLIQYRLCLVNQTEVSAEVLARVDLTKDGKLSLVDLIAARKLLIGLPIS